MASYSEMTAEQLAEQQAALLVRYNDYKSRELSLDITRGKPGADQLELSMSMLDALNSKSGYTDCNGVDCRNYGGVIGIPEARQLFASVFDVSMDEIIVGGNSSLNMMFDTISSAMGNGLLGGEPWAKQGRVKFLCPCPGYDRHFAICEYFDIEMIPIKNTPTGPDMDEVERLVQSDPLVKGIWCVPKYSNPTGITYSDETVMRFARLKPAAKDFRIFWDNSYFVHHLFGEDVKLLNLLKECEKYGNGNMVYMYFSTSKITFPGAGLAGMATSVENVKAITHRMGIQTIGPDKLNQLRHMKFIKDYDGLLAQMSRHAEIIRPKFLCVLETLEKELEGFDVATWTKPDGGYFISLDTMKGCAKRTYDLCLDAGVKLTKVGATFPYGKDPDDTNIRIAPTFPTLEELELAIEVLCVCVKLAAIEKLLEKAGK
ncbi:MAG: aminotransferase class I/II-fold pyridoxal phosphate-dependent enzyme [Clostridia bacterium]|nr:aminotransferase class I/II-fold pyridoxal phosphate-dependent enzyme [Clostridia bacterium]